MRAVKEETSENEESVEGEVIERRMEWTKYIIEGIPPTPRGGHSATLFKNQIIIFGGHYYSDKETGFKYLNETYILDIENNKWLKAHTNATPPPPRYYHSAVLYASRIIIFGGRGASGSFMDTYALDPATMTWYVGPEGSGSPSARFGHSASLVNGNLMVVFGGSNGEKFFNDVNILHLETMSWVKPELSGPAPSPRYLHSAIAYKNFVLVHGGFAFHGYDAGQPDYGSRLRDCYYNDMRLLDVNARCWKRFNMVSGKPMAPRFGHSMNFSRNHLIIFGGWSNNAQGKRIVGDNGHMRALNLVTYEWENISLQNAMPKNRYGHSATSFKENIIVFGGWEFNRSTNELIILKYIDED